MRNLVLLIIGALLGGLSTFGLLRFVQVEHAGPRPVSADTVSLPKTRFRRIDYTQREAWGCSLVVISGLIPLLYHRTNTAMSVCVVGERLIAEVNQQRMVLPVEPKAKDSETAVLWPTPFVGPPRCQLLVENFYRQLPQGFLDVAFRVTFGDKVDCRILL